MQQEDFERLRNSLADFAEHAAKALEPFLETINNLWNTPVVQAWWRAKLAQKNREEVLRTQLAIYTHCKHKSVQHKIEAIENELAKNRLL